MAVSAQVVPPSQNSAISGSENLSAGHYYNWNSYARDESKIRQQTTTIANNAEGTRDVAAAISEPVPLSPIEPISPYYLTPVELLYPYYSTPAEITYPFYGLPLEYANPYYGIPVDQGYYGFPAGVPTVPYYAPPYTAYADSLYPYYGVPTPGYYDYQHGIPYITSPVFQAGGIATEPLLNPSIELPPVEFVDPILLQALYPGFPVQTHNSANNNFKSVTAVANPVSAASEIVADNIVHSKDVLPIIQPLAA